MHRNHFDYHNHETLVVRVCAQAAKLEGIGYTSRRSLTHFTLANRPADSYEHTLSVTQTSLLNLATQPEHGHRLQHSNQQRVTHTSCVHTGIGSVKVLKLAESAPLATLFTQTPSRPNLSFSAADDSTPNRHTAKRQTASRHRH